jgi:hypothetical protein
MTNNQADRIVLVDRIAAMPKSNEDLNSTWCPPDWEAIAEWYDDIIDEARKLSPKRYR